MCIYIHKKENTKSGAVGYILLNTIYIYIYIYIYLDAQL